MLLLLMVALYAKSQVQGPCKLTVYFICISRMAIHMYVDEACAYIIQ